LNATPPELLALDITVAGRGAGLANAPQQAQGAAGMMGGGMRGMGGSMGMMATGGRAAQMFRDQSRELRQKAQVERFGNRVEAGKNFINEAAALEQTDELLAKNDEKLVDPMPFLPQTLAAATTTHEGPSVTYHLRSRLTVPSRNDQQLIEVARIETKPEYYYK